MADNKNSIIFYRDWKEIFEDLNDRDCAELIRHIFRYVNDENPVTENQIVKAHFIHIKNALKRDLKKWETIKVKRSEAGKASAKARKQKSTKSTSVKSVEQKPTNPTVSVNDSVSVNVNDILLKKETKKLFNDWLDYRKEIKKPIKSEKTKIALAKKIEEKGIDVSEQIIKTSIENGWQGLFWDKQQNLKKEKVAPKRNAGQIIKDRINNGLS